MNLNTFNYKLIDYTVKIINTKKKINYNYSHKSLLLTLELNNILIDYQCRSGYCGICRINLIKGNVYYPKKKPIASTFSKKEIFPCCCQPTSNICIEI